MFPKTTRWLSKEYTDHVKSYTCARCCTLEVDGHHWAPKHLGDKGTARKLSDCFQVPLCRFCHSTWHQSAALPGWDRARCELEFRDALIQCMADWIRKGDTF